MAGRRIVAELGRPETPAETADRKAAASAAYRSSKTFRNLIAALVVTVAVVVIVAFGVPRGEAPEPKPVDVAAAAESTSASLGVPLLVPEVPSDWRANSARVEDRMWRVVYAPPKGQFVRIAQGLATDAGWPTEVLGGFAPTGTVTIAGLEWDEYDIPDAARAGNVTYALATPAGEDTVLVYGTMTAETAAVAAESVADQVRNLREETE